MPGLVSDSMVIHPVGHVVCSRRVVADDDWDREQTKIVLTPRFGPEALAGLSEFSHLEVVYVFDRVADDEVEVGARRPRGNPAWPPVGIFAQRAKARPNRLGITVCELLAVEGRDVHVRGLDAVDGTPVMDLKPWFEEFGPRGERHQPPWVSDLMADYWHRDAPASLP